MVVLNKSLKIFKENLSVFSMLSLVMSQVSAMLLVITGHRLLSFAHGGSCGAVLMDLPRFLYERRTVFFPLLPQ